MIVLVAVIAQALIAAGLGAAAVLIDPAQGCRNHLRRTFKDAVHVAGATWHVVVQNDRRRLKTAVVIERAVQVVAANIE